MDIPVLISKPFNCFKDALCSCIEAYPLLWFMLTVARHFHVPNFLNIALYLLSYIFRSLQWLALELPICLLTNMPEMCLGGIKRYQKWHPFILNQVVFCFLIWFIKIPWCVCMPISSQKSPPYCKYELICYFSKNVRVVSEQNPQAYLSHSLTWSSCCMGIALIMDTLRL